MRTNTAKFNQGMTQANRKLDGFRNTISKATRVLGVFGVALGGAALTRFVRDSISAGDAIGKTADKVGVGVEALQELRFAAEQSGVANNTLDMALQRLSRRLGEADQGSGELLGTLQKYNIETRDAEGNIRSTEAVLGDLADTIKNAESNQEALRIAFKAFDSEGAALVNTLRDGSDGLNKMRQQARELGIVMDEQMIRSAEEINDKFNILARTMDVKLKSAILGVATAFNRLFNATERNKLLQQIDNIQERIESVTEDINESKDKANKQIEDALGEFGFAGISKNSIEDNEKILNTLQESLKKAQTELKKLDGGFDEIAKRPPPAVLKKKNEAPATAAAPVETGAFFQSLAEQASDAFQIMRDIGEEGRAVFEATRTPAEQLNIEIARLNDLLGAGAIDFDTYSRAVFDAQDQFDDLKETAKTATEELNGAAKELGFTFSSAFEDAIVNGSKFSGVLKSLEQDILRIVTRRLITEPLSDGITGLIGSVIPAFASGTNFAPGGMALVGEKGPELVNLPRGSQVIPNNKMGGTTININVSAPNGRITPESMSQLQAAAARAVSRGSRNL